jgi:ABC-type branched-subunit amino acid transport system ATPase component
VPAFAKEALPLLDVREVTAGYGGMEILHGVSIRVDAGEMVTLIGPNGAGKSTLLKTIFGVLAPTRGDVRLRGQAISGLPPEAIVRRGVAYVPQVDNVFPSLTVEENLAMGAVTRRDDPSARMAAVAALFPTLAAKRRRKAGELSGGERQMVAMGRALMLDPALLLLDEPSAGLSPLVVEQVFTKIAEINGAGVAVLLVEQNAREALARSHRGYVLAAGQNRLEGPGPALLENAEVGRLYLGG